MEQKEFDRRLEEVRAGDHYGFGAEAAAKLILDLHIEALHDA